MASTPPPSEQSPITASCCGVVLKHEGQRSFPESVAQLRNLGRAACIPCDTVRSRRCRRCTVCGSDTPLRDLRVRDTFEDRRQPGHQDAAPGGMPAGQHLPRARLPYLQVTPFDDSPLPNCPVQDISLAERDKQVLAELRRAAMAWAESLEGAMSGHQSWALLCHYRCRLLLAEVPKGTDRNAELKLRLQLWETGRVSELISQILGQHHSGPLHRRKRVIQPQTDEQRGKRACALTAWGSISNIIKGLVGGAAQGSADCRRNWTTALIPRSPGIGTHPTAAERVRAARIAWGGVRCKAARSAMRVAGPEQNRYRFAATTTGERQEHLYAIVSFAGASLRRRLFRGLDILRIKGRQETCRKSAHSSSTHN